MVQTRLVNIETGSNSEHRFRSEDKVDRAIMEEHSLQFSYRAGDDYHFMNTESYEMTSLSGDVLGEAVGYLIEGMVIQAMYFEGRVVGVEVPMFVELTVTGDHAEHQGSDGRRIAQARRPSRPGSRSRVPQYINVGDRVKIDTRTGSSSSAPDLWAAPQLGAGSVARFSRSRNERPRSPDSAHRSTRSPQRSRPACPEHAGRKFCWERRPQSRGPHPRIFEAPSPKLEL